MPNNVVSAGMNMLQVLMSFRLRVTYSRLGASNPACLGFFLSVGADNSDACQIFLRLGAERGERRLNFFVEFVNHLAEIPDDDGDDRNGKQNPKAERGRKRDHQDDGQNHRDDGGGAVHDAGAENHADVVQIVGAARHDFAGAVADVKFRLLAQQGSEQIVAQIEFDVAGNSDQNPAIPVRKNSFDGDSRRQGRGRKLRESGRCRDGST